MAPSIEDPAFDPGFQKLSALDYTNGQSLLSFNATVIFKMCSAGGISNTNFKYSKTL